MNDPGALRIVQLTDTHLRAERGELVRGQDPDATLNAVLTAIAAEGLPDLFLLTGDLVEDPVADAYRRVRELVGNTGVPAWCLPGNHDDLDLMRTELNRDGLATPRARRVNGWLLVLLDSTIPGDAGGELGSSELAGLADTLSSYPDEPALVALHHPPVALGSRWIDALGLADAESFFEVIEDNPQVRAVIWGHAHQAWDGNWEDTLLLGTPSTGTQFLPGADEYAHDTRPPGWRTLELHQDGRIDTEVRWLEEKTARSPIGEPPRG
ncbi:MAG: phosphodiesterase [Gammaproteobacteria bacterium]